MRVIGLRMAEDSGELIPYRPSPNSRPDLDPRFIVLHYTAGRSLQSAVNWLSSKSSQLSAHFVVGRSGEIFQLVALDRQAWHAGRSTWEGKDGTRYEKLNGYSFGIELDNPGLLRKAKDGSGYVTGFGMPVVDDEILHAEHKNGGQPQGWHKYSDAQVQKTYELCEALIDRFPTIQDVIGHDDIAPGRKFDPGPAFDMEGFRAKLFGKQ